jgi:Uma2 family endonuclease
MAVRFPDGSIRRPDIGVFCERPAATQEATRTLPQAVVEIVSPGSDVKDLELSPPSYLRHGVLDVVVMSHARARRRGSGRVAKRRVSRRGGSNCGVVAP